MLNRHWGLAVAALLWAGDASALRAQEIDPDPRFWVEGGAYLPSANSEFSLSSPDSDTGTEVSLEDDLGFETKASSIDLTFGAKIDDEFFGELSFFAINRDTSATLGRQIVIEDVTYDVGAEVQSSFGSDVLRASLGFRPVVKKDWDLAVLVGAYTTRFGFTIVGEANVNGQTATAVQRARDLVAPLPTIGLQAQYRPAKWLQLRARADYFKLAVGKYDGRLSNLEASATVAVSKNLGLGAAWRFTEYRLAVDDDDYRATISYALDGLRLFVRATF